MKPLFAFDILDVLPDPIIWVYPVFENDELIDFEARYSNKAADEGIKHPKGSLTGLRILGDGIPSVQSAPGNFKHFLEVYTTGETKEHVFFAHHSNKQYETVRRPFEGGVLSTTRDRREQREAERKEQEKTRLLNNILKYSSNGITVGRMVRDDSGRIIDIGTVMANEAAVNFTGIPKEDYLTKTGGELDPSFINSPYFQQCVHCMETGQAFLIQYFLEPKQRWLEVSVSKMDEEHQIYIFTDITSIKQAQLAIERSEAQLQTIINRTQSGIFTAAPVFNESGEVIDFQFVIVNRALAGYVHQQPEKLVGELGSKWFAGYKANGLFELFLDTYVNKRMNRFDFHYNHDGIDAWIDMMCTAFDGEILVTFSDYTPVKKLQLELQKLVEELKRSNSNLEEFAYAASHDLQEPLRKIETFSDRLRRSFDGQSDESQQGMFDRIGASTVRMRTLINDLLNYSQLGIKLTTATSVDLNEVVQEVVHDLEAVILETGAHLEIESLPAIEGDKVQLTQMFQNLLGNALKYKKRDIAPQITISCGVTEEVDTGSMGLNIGEGQYHRIEISDNGIGFEQQHTEKIFQVFQRLHSRSEYEGTGVGLALVQRIVHNHNGHIVAKGEPGKGSTFTVFLPK